MKKTATPLEEFRKKSRPVPNANTAHKESLSSMDLFAIWITDHIGTMGFFLIIFFWTVIWLGINTLGPQEYHFDPYPAFVLWLIISNMIQIFLMPLLLIGQNLQGRHAEARAEADFQVNTKAEEEIEAILTHLENQDEMLSEILGKLEDR